ncbi:MAG TPA: X2-like carbohydrate binding domain-containing protein, partial [Clostridia bacterium]
VIKVYVGLGLNSISLSSGKLSPQFDPQIASYDVILPYGSKTVPVVTALPKDSSARVNISNDASLPGDTEITVSSPDGSYSSKYTIHFTVAQYLESSHPYANGSNETWEYTEPNFIGNLQLTFSTDTLLGSYDYLTVTDKYGNYVSGSPFSGNSLSGKTITVKGNTVRIRLNSNGGFNMYGFRVTNITPVKLDITGISTNVDQYFLSLNESYQLKVDANLSDGSKTDVTNAVYYDSDNTSIATVNQSGLITSIAPGNANISVRYKDYSAIVRVNIDPNKIESKHPYDNNFDYTWTYTCPVTSASSIKLQFNPQTNVENYCDNIFIMDGNGMNIQGSPFTGNSLAGATVEVPGNIFKIRLRADGSITGYGFKIDAITPEIAPVTTPGAITTPTPGAITTPTPGAITTPTPGAITTPTPGAITTPTPIPVLGSNEVHVDAGNLCDVSVNIGNNTLQFIKNGAGTLNPTVDYKISNNIVTINKQYLKYYFTKFPDHNLYLNFNYGNGNSSVLTIYTGTTPHVVLTPDVISYDLKSGDAELNFVPNGNFIGAIRSNDYLLVQRIDYSFAPSTNTLYIRKGFLNNYFSNNPGPLMLTVYFTGDQPKTIIFNL